MRDNSRLAKTFSTIPVCKEIYVGVITLLRKLAALSGRYSLLESIEVAGGTIPIPQI